MLLVPGTVYNRYVEHLKVQGVATTKQADYSKWLRYFLDFCDKYPVPAAKTERVRLFCEKLQEKKQSHRQQEQAAHAISLYFEMEMLHSAKFEEGLHQNQGLKLMYCLK